MRILRSAQFHELVPLMIGWGRQGDISYVQEMRTQLVAASAVAEALADLATAADDVWSAPSTEALSPRSAGHEESMVAMATLLAARTGEPLKIEGVDNTADPDHELYTTDAPLPVQARSSPARRSRSGSTASSSDERRPVIGPPVSRRREGPARR